MKATIRNNNPNNEIHAKDGVEVTDNLGLKMLGETGIYKNEEILELKNNVSVIDENKNIELNTEKLLFNKKLNLILSEKRQLFFLMIYIQLKEMISVLIEIIQSYHPRIKLV